MGAHIFLVGADNFEICVRYGVYGCVFPKSEWNRAEIVASLYSIQPGDLMFFYVKNRGVYGAWKIVSIPFFDETSIWNNDTQSFPYRFLFESTIGHFPNPVLLSDVLELRDNGLIWTFDLNPVQQKNQYKITIAEAQQLLRLLLRNNPLRSGHQAITTPYVQPSSAQQVNLDLTPDKHRRVKYEGWLNAWFMQALAMDRLHNILGTYREFINLVPTSYNKVMDVFLTHVETIDSIDIVYKFTCIELKADLAGEDDLSQILRYENWLTRKLANGDYDMVQSILVANRFSDALIEYVRNRRRIEQKTVRLLKYCVNSDSTDIELSEQAIM